MRPDRQDFLSSLCWQFSLFMLLTCGATAVLAQKTVVQDAGGGRKMELVYNAAGQVTEQRMLGPDGKLTSKTEYEYRPGFFQAQEVATTYWPNGGTKTIIRTSYDPNANFTLEFAQVYDESGKQIGGHRLTHAPETNVFHCYEWDASAHDYKEIRCPAGEGGGGEEGPEEVKKYSYEEVAQHLETARNTALQEQKAQRRRPMAPERYPSTTVNKEIGLVLPAQIGSGAKFSGTVVEDPQHYDGMPGVMVFRFTLPFSSTGTGSSLMDWEVVSGKEPPQRADEPVTFALAPRSSDITVTFRQSGSPASSVSKIISLAQAKSKPNAPTSFKAPAVCVMRQLCPVSGPFSGDSRETFAAFEDRPASIVTETPEMAYIGIPPRAGAGAPSLYIAEGAKLIALPVVVAELTLDPERRDITKGQTFAMNVRVDGPEELPEQEWRAGNFPASNLAQARKLVPGYQAPRQERGTKEAREHPEAKDKGQVEAQREEKEQEGRNGEILLIVKNETPQQATMRNSQNQGYVFPLRAKSFKRGGFSYDFVVEPVLSGSFAVKGYVIPFLAPVAGQEFAVKTGNPGQ